jgi:hypothetical protein
MICPGCGSDSREGDVRCSACDTDLAGSLPPEPKLSLVKVYETGNAAIIPVYESLLNDAGIEYMAKGESIQDLFGWGRFGSNLNYVIGPVEFYVRADAADEARQIAETLQSPSVE